MKTSHSTFIYILLHVLLLFSLPLRITSSAEALVKWKSNLSSASFLDSWSISNLRNFCNWTSIVCNAGGTISEINLSDAGLSGSLDQLDFTSFPSLTSFILNGNNISGSIPSNIGNASMLNFLDLSNNILEGVIPEEIGKLTQLEYLSFYNNNIDGVIPYQISNLQKLWYLDLGSNFLETPEWSKLRNMPMLTQLSFGYNELRLEFPEFVLRYHNLTYLDLPINHFDGSIPETVFTNLDKLEYLNLSSNSFQGKIPSSIGRLGILQQLDLRKNRLNSAIPSELGLCTNLTILALAGNALQGTLPISLSSLTKLSQLALSDNNLSGEISSYLITNWTELMSLQLQNNSFTGVIYLQFGITTDSSFGKK
ncbi:receptor-like protein 53 [Lycium barbarum]|uniref:receptor-like protein 53 n=1 Tax=Lycium barbarum TaxID=112863 RepID=UPI00293F6CCE|nr:receptor-like protein 53 [Lycium barbarum]